MRDRAGPQPDDPDGRRDAAPDRPAAGEAPEGTERLAPLAQMMGELAHDLANEIAVLQGWALLARGEAEAGRAAGPELERVVELSGSLGEMLRDVLTVAGGGLVSPEVDFDPMRVTERALGQRVLEHAGLTVRLRANIPEGTRVRGFASFWTRILGNLLTNAGRHARSEVLVTVKTEGAEVVLRVEDDGPGLPADVGGRIYDPLWTGEHGRLGLGLSSAAWLAARLGGRITHGTAPSLGGAAFEVRAPLVPQRLGSAAPADPAPRQVLSGLRILLVDDDAGVRRALTRLLQRVGVEVRELDPAGEAEDLLFEALVAAVPDVILLDLRLGRRGGIELSQKVATEFAALASRIIFISGGGPGDPDWDAAERTGQPVLAKPFTLQELSATVAALLQTS